MIFAEAGISGLRKPLPSIRKSGRILAQISSATLFFKIVLSTASVILTSFAMFYQRFEFFPIAFGVNVALGWTVSLAHAAGNPKINTMLIPALCHKDQQSKDLAVALATYGFLAPLVNMLPWEDHWQDYPSILCNCILEILMLALTTITQMTPTISHLLI
uniref:Uncharacterized protein n=1 Tax=Romanomermis culicivorax TaxID=13658 RepID=A0A915IBT0_ROMCU